MRIFIIKPFSATQKNISEAFLVAIGITPWSVSHLIRFLENTLLTSKGWKKYVWMGFSDDKITLFFSFLVQVIFEIVFKFQHFFWFSWKFTSTPFFWAHSLSARATADFPPLWCCSNSQRNFPLKFLSCAFNNWKRQIQTLWHPVIEALKHQFLSSLY